MLQHPGIELSDIIKEKGLTQKAFSIILGKKVSEVNELLKGKRNITIQRDFLLHKTLGTPIKYRILKQVDYEYSLINTENADESINESFNENISFQPKVSIDKIQEEFENKQNIEIEKQSKDNENNEENIERIDEIKEKEEIENNEEDIKNNEEYQNRLKIFRSF